MKKPSNFLTRNCAGKSSFTPAGGIFRDFSIKLQSKSQIVKKMLKNFVEILRKGVKLIGMIQDNNKKNQQYRKKKMKITKMLLLLSAAAGLAFTATACSDEDEELKASRFWRDDVRAPASDPYAQGGNNGGSDLTGGDGFGGVNVLDGDGNVADDPNQPGAYGDFNAEQNDYVQGFGRRITDPSAQFAPVYFDFDTFAVPHSELSKIDAIVAFMTQNPGTGVVVEGNCDERGTQEYNRALGERRALAVKATLLSRGIAESRIRTLSYGEDKPAVEGSDEIAWSRNRRAEFVMVLMNQQ